MPLDDISTIEVFVNQWQALPPSSFSLNGSSNSVSLVAGNNITLQSNASTITIVGGAGGGGAAFTLNASTGSLSLVAGANVGFASNASTITISASNSANVVSAMGTAGAMSTGSITFVAGNNITLNTGASSITIVGPTVPTATNFSLNATSSSVSLSAGAGIGIGQGASTITISASVQPEGTQSFSGGGTSITGTAISVALVGGNNISLASASGAGSLTLTFNASSNALNNVSLLNASSGALSVSAGAGIGIGQANSTITVSASVQTSSVSLTALGNTTSSSSGTFSNLLNVSGAGIVSVGVGAGSMTISATTPSVTNYSTITATMAGNNLGGASTTVTIGNSFSLSGAGVVSVGASGGTITISAPAAAAGTVISAVQISGNTFGTSSLISNGTVYLQAVSNIYLSQSTTTGTGSTTSNVISIGGPAYAAGGGLAVSTTGGSVSYSITNHVSSLNGSSGVLSVSAGAGIGIGQAASTITVSASNQTSSLSYVAALGTAAATSTGTIVLAAGANITLNTGANSITIVGPSAAAGAAKISYTQNFPLAEAFPMQVGVLTTTGTTAASAAANPFGSSLSIQRFFIPAPMTLTEVDLAFGISFPATNQGQGSMSQSFALYSFGNSSSLASVVSASRAVTWATGTTTSGTSSSLQQGWASNNIQPFTFASSTIAAGEYAVAHLMSWAAASTSWTISVFGANLTSASFSAGSAHTASTSLAAIAFSTPNAPSNIPVITATGSAQVTLWTAAPTNISLGKVATTASLSANTLSNIVATATAASTASLLLNAGTAATTVVTVAAGGVTALGSAGNFVLSSFSILSSGGLQAGSFVTSTGAPNFNFNGSLAMTTNSTQATFQPYNFAQGIMATGSAPTSVALSSTAVTVTGSTALIQPWFALAGN